MAYTTIDDPGLFFNTVLYTGNGGSQTITGVGFQPDFVWFKTRDGTHAHALVDSVRGTDKVMHSNTTQAEQSISSQTFNSDGYALVADGTANSINSSGSTKVAWNWKAGTSFTNDASGTGIGSVDSTGSINTTAGISIMSWTSLASGSNYTIAHGLSATPAVIIMKGRHEANSWIVYHHKNTAAPETDYLSLDTTAATADYHVWNDTAPTSSVFSLGTWSGLDDGGTMIAYCFAEKQGYSKFGSYTGNGSTDGTFVYTGFKPAFVMIKRTDATASWLMFDNKRVNPFNEITADLRPDSSQAEDTSTTYNTLDFLSNGFKLNQLNGDLNASGSNYIYMAFAENPFVSSSGVPACAR